MMIYITLSCICALLPFPVFVATKFPFERNDTPSPLSYDCWFIAHFLQNEEFQAPHGELLIFLREVGICREMKFTSRYPPNTKHSSTPFIAFQQCSDKFKGVEIVGKAKYSALLFLCNASMTVNMLEIFNKKTGANFLQIFVRVPEGNTLMKQLQKVNHIPKLLLIESRHQGGFNVLQISRPLPKWHWVKTVITKLNSRLQGNTFHYELFSEAIYSNFESQVVRVAAVMNSYYSFDTKILEKEDGSYEFLPSFAVDLLRGLTSTLNFTAIPVVTTSWGHLVNSTWEGMIGLLVKDEADIAISSASELPFRREVVDFNLPTTHMRLSAFFRRPPSYVLANPLTRPFNDDLWVAILVTMLALAVALCVASQLLRNASRGVGEFRWGKADCFHWILSTMCWNGNYAKPRETPLRVLVCTTLFLSMIICGAYGGTLLSFLFLRVEPIGTLAELLSTEFKFEIVDDPISIKTLAESPSMEGRKIYNRSLNGRKTMSMKEAVEELNGGSFVLVVDDMSGYKSLEQDFTNQDACQIKEFTIGYSLQNEASMVRKGSNLRKILDFQILRMLEFGLIRKWEKTYLTQKPSCQLWLDSRRFAGIRIESIEASLGAFAVTILISSFILFIEIYKSQIFQIFVTLLKVVVKVHTYRITQHLVSDVPNYTIP